MMWAELSVDLSTWTIPADRAKNGVAHIVPLREPARELLRGLPEFSDFVFPGLRGKFSGCSNALATGRGPMCSNECSTLCQMIQTWNTR
jgi:integrase